MKNNTDVADNVPIISIIPVEPQPNGVITVDSRFTFANKTSVIKEQDIKFIIAPKIIINSTSFSHYSDDGLLFMSAENSPFVDTISKSNQPFCNFHFQAPNPKNNNKFNDFKTDDFLETDTETPKFVLFKKFETKSINIDNSEIISEGRLLESRNDSPQILAIPPLPNQIIEAEPIVSHRKLVLGKIIEKYNSLSKSETQLFWITLIISLLIYVASITCVVLFLLVPRLSGTKNFKWACSSRNMWTNASDQICFFAAGQSAFGVVAVGQLALGIIAIGQVSLGIFTMGQASVSVIFTLVSQISTSMIVAYSQFNVSVLYVRYTLLGTSPLKPLIENNSKTPISVACD